MHKSSIRNSRGFTITEVMMAAAIAVIVVLGIAVVLADNYRGWNAMYDRVYSDVVTDGYVAKRMFDSVVRKSSSQGVDLDSNGQSVEVCYYEDLTSTVPDRYMRIFKEGANLRVEHGQLNPQITLSVETVCSNVSACAFKRIGNSLQMLLTLDNGSQELTMVTSAVLHN